MSEGKNNQAEKEMTIGDLAILMTDGFEKSSKQTDKKIESLARLVQNSLLELKSDIKESKDELRKEITNAKEDIKAEVNKKVDTFTHKDLEIRVEKVEEKLQLKPKLKFA